MTNRFHYTELASGLHYWQGGQWRDSREEIEAVTGGAAAAQGAHGLVLDANLNTLGAVQATLPDGRLLRSHVLGVAYTDRNTGQSVFVAQVRNAEGFLLPSNQVIYPAALGTAGDVRYTYTKAGVEQDIIIRERLPSPATLGLSPETTRVEVWTEFLEAPEPRLREHRFANGEIDQLIDFGGMQIGRGAAFLLDDGTVRASRARVFKQWVKVGNRTFLIESLPYRAIERELSTLPPPQAALPNVEKTSRLALLKATPGPTANRSTQPMKLAARGDWERGQGLVLDYVLVNVDTNPFTFFGDQTYHVSGPVYMADLRIEGGSVVKYSRDALVNVSSSLDCLSSSHRVALFTAVDDDTAGEIISGSTGTPSGFYAYGALWLGQPDMSLHDVRVAYASAGLGVVYDAAVRNAQFTYCDEAVELSLCNFTAENVLFHRSGTVLYGGYEATVRARQITASDCRQMVYAPDNLFALNLTNSLLVNVTNWGTGLYYTNATAFVTNTASVFQTVGAGAHYLPTNSPYHHLGTTNLPGELLTNLWQRTTVAPQVITNAIIATNLTLDGLATGISAAQCGLPVETTQSTAPSLGYHYAPLNYVFGSNVLTNATLVLTNGVALATFTPGSNTHGLLMLGGARLVASGQPTNLVRITRYNLVQEQASSAWSSSQVGASIRTATNAVSPPPSGFMLFAELSAPAQANSFYGSRSNRAEFAFRHCEFGGGRFSTYGPQVSFTNCLWESVTAYFTDAGPVTNTNRWWQNSFINGQADFYNVNTAWQVFNTLFFNTTLGCDSGFNHGWNAYADGNPLLCGWSSNSLSTEIEFETGPLGRYYLAAGSPLLNRGTNTAGTFGLYHFTTLTAQTRETNSTADIGFHRVALNAANSPVDTDGDALADFLEDANGNGSQDSGETSLTDTDTDYDGRTDGQEAAEGTSGASSASVTPVRLASFHFDDTNWLGSAGQNPLLSSNVTSRDAWLSKGAGLDSTNAAVLKYRTEETNGAANLNLRNGAVRFWFQPSGWTSNGPNGEGRLLEVGSKGAGTTNGWWALYFNTNGTQLTFSIQTNNAGINLLTASLTTWCVREWHQLVLNYTPSNTALYLDATLLATNGGVPYWPSASVRSNGFTIGSGTNGTNQARGLFEDFETFNYPLTTNEITANFETNRPPIAIPNLKMWLKADSSLLIPDGNSVRVSAWPDETCFANDAVQGGLKRPYFIANAINSKPAVHFYRSNYFNLPRFPTNWLEAEVFLVIKVEEPIPSVSRTLWKWGDVSQGQAYYPNSGGNIIDYFGRKGGSDNIDVGRPRVNITDPHIYNVSSKTNDWACRLNGVLHSATKTNIYNGFTTGDRTLGINSSDGSLDGLIGEILVFDRVLTAEERHQVMTYLNQRFGLCTNPPAAPSLITASAVSPTQMDVSWETTLTTTNTSFSLERKTGAGAFERVALLENKKSHFDTGLQTNTAYSYRVKALGYGGYSDYCTSVTATTMTSGASIPLSSLRMWLKADSGWGAGPVAFLEDQSGSGNHAVQNAWHSRPYVEETLQVGGVTRQMIAFHQTNHFALHFTTTKASQFYAADGFAVLKTASLLGASRPFWVFGYNNFYPDANQNIIDGFFRGGSSGNNTGPASVTLTNLHLYNATSISTGWTNRMNGALHFPTNSSLHSPNYGVWDTVIPGIGSQGGAQTGNDRFHGRFAEIMLFDANLTAGERQAVENYLNRRFSLW